MKKIIAIICALALTVTSFAAFAQTEGHWAEETLENWMAQGLISGYADGSVMPDREVTRAEFAKLLYGALLKNGYIEENEGESPFSDVTSVDWFFAPVCALYQNRIMTGKTAQTFEPSGKMTREAAATAIARAIGAEDHFSNKVSEYSDADDVASYAEPYVAALTERGIMTGYGQNASLMPKKTITRAEAVTLIDRALRFADKNMRPNMTANFVDPFKFENYSDQRLSMHFDSLKEAGMTDIVIDWCCVTTLGTVIEDHTGENGAVELILKQAQQHGMRVYVGLNFSEEWWSQSEDETWRSEQLEIAREQAQKLYEAYGEKYSDAFYGWFFPWTVYVGGDMSDWAGEFIGDYKAMLENTGKPMMVSAVLTGSEHAVRDWKKILEKSALDENDVLCLRDLQGERINEMGGLIAAVYEAAQQTGCSKLWAVISLCDGETPNTLALSSVIRSMRIAAPYVDKIGGDSYSAHFCPDMKRTQEHHEQYLSYLNGGDKGE